MPSLFTKMWSKNWTLLFNLIYDFAVKKNQRNNMKLSVPYCIYYILLPHIISCWIALCWIAQHHKRDHIAVALVSYVSLMYRIINNAKRCVPHWPHWWVCTSLLKMMNLWIKDRLHLILAHSLQITFVACMYNCHFCYRSENNVIFGVWTRKKTNNR